jgi:sugar lactone lactonase YvrE
VLWSDITFTAAKPVAHGGLRAGNIMRYDPKSGEVSVFRSPSGMSNGLRIDQDCNLLAAEGAYTPMGEEKAYIPTTIPTNVHFGRGEDANTLYITADSSLYRIRTNKRGHHLPQQR